MTRLPAAAIPRSGVWCREECRAAADRKADTMATRFAFAAVAVSAAVVLSLDVLRALEREDSAPVGLNTHLVWAPPREAEAVLDEIRDLGIGWVREEIPWRVVEPERGRFDWSRTDVLMAAASSSRVDVLGILAYSAPWASDAVGDERHPPRDPSDYARYAAAVVSRYGPGGSFWNERRELEPRPLRAVEIWNEPWTHSTWRPDPDPAAYARLVRAAVAAIREVEPTTTIAIAGDLLQVRTDGDVVPWLEELLRADPELPGLVDVYSLHPYPDPRTDGPYDDREDGRWDFRRVELVRAVDASLPIWITEVGWSTADTDDSVSEEAQAEYVDGAVRRAFEDWGDYVERVFVYSFDRDTGDRGDREGHYGLIRKDGSAKPAAAVLEQLAGAELGG